jgi:hypothetical protein
VDDLVISQIADCLGDGKHEVEFGQEREREVFVALVLVEIAGVDVVHDDRLFAEGVGVVDRKVVLRQVWRIGILELGYNFHFVLVAAVPFSLFELVFVLLFDHHAFLKHVLG